jgi:arginase
MRKTIQIIGAPMDLGQSHRGVDMGPSAIRYAGLAGRLKTLGYAIQDRGNVQVPVRDALAGGEENGYLTAIQRVCEEIYQAGKNAVEQGFFPLFLGGDHSIAIGSIGGVTHLEPVGVLWIDAHGDFHTPETSHSGNVHGMPLAALLGNGPAELVDVGRQGPKLKSSDVVLIGIRDLDPAEKIRLKEQGIRVYTMRDIDERGMSAITHEALARLGHRQRLHVSLDVDGLDPKEAPGVGTPVPGGFTYREAQLLMEILADSQRLVSMDIVEINPILDQQNRTASIAVELAASAFGKRII